MQWTGLNELREKYLHYFETKGHLRLGSFPLVPKRSRVSAMPKRKCCTTRCGMVYNENVIAAL